MTNDVIMKEVEPQWIVSLREHIPTYRVVGQLIGKLYGLLGPLGGHGMGVGLLHDPEYKEQNVDVEAGVYLKQPTKVEAPLRCYQLPAATVASVVHHGAFNRIGGGSGVGAAGISLGYKQLLLWHGRDHRFDPASQEGEARALRENS